MSEWSSEQYLKFKEQRTQPAADLAGRIAGYRPGSVLDIGCGPGNSTAVLKGIFPCADILGIDSSEDMIKKAEHTYPDMSFRLCNAARETDKLGKYDVIFSNACLQWIPEHEKFIPCLMEHLNNGGVLAVQMPMNGQEPVMRIMDEAVKEPKWGFAEMGIEANAVLAPSEYFDILSGCARSFDIWETVYYHSMPDAGAMTEWVKGTRLRPYLNALDAVKATELEKEITERAASVYEKRCSGEIIFRFRRFFFTAVK